MALSGCGTVHNLSSEKSEPYGGVALAVENASSSHGLHGWIPGVFLLQGAARCCWAVDIPLSLVGDTLTLPFTTANEGSHSGGINALRQPQDVVADK